MFARPYLLKVGLRRSLTLVDVYEDVVNLQDVVEFGIDAVPVVEDLVLVAGYLEFFLA